MVSITLSVQPKIKELMKQFPELNWSGFIRTCIESKVKQLTLKQELLARLEQEDASGFTKWSIEMGRKVNKDISKKLKEEKLL